MEEDGRGMRWGSSHAWILGAFATLALSGCASNLDKGNEAFAKKDYGTAITEYTVSVEGNGPEKGEALYKRCLAKLNKGDDAGAHADYDEAVRQTATLATRSEYPDFFYDRAIAEAQIDGDSTSRLRSDVKAKADYDEALRIRPELAKKPDFAEVFYARAIEKIKAGDGKEAEADEAQAGKIQPNKARHLDFLSAYLGSRDPKDGYTFLLSMKQARQLNAEEAKLLDKAEDAYLTWALGKIDEFKAKGAWDDARQGLETMTRQSRLVSKGKRHG